MPRVEAATESGLHMPGIYQALLEYERAKYERRGEVVVCEGRDIRVSWVDKADHSHGFFLYQRHQLDRLEAGEQVVVDRTHVETALWDQDRDQSRRSVRLPFERSVRSVRVSPDDRTFRLRFVNVSPQPS
jgi:hypothetical protein